MTNEHFSRSYVEARTRFRENAVRAGAAVSSSAHPFAKGCDGEPLSTDVAWLGPPNPGGVVIVTSGTHGVEGYAGSGFQCGLLAEGGAVWYRENVGVLLVHAINPFGFSHSCRVNEENVDLNRNFVDFSEPLPKTSAVYERLHDVVVPTEWTGEHKRRADEAINKAWTELGERKFQDGVCRGQYMHADGLFYGGRAGSWSNAVWRACLASLPRSTKYVAHIDLHTGLGSFGYGEILFPLAPDSPSRSWALEWYENLGLRTAGSSESSATTIAGAMNHAVLDASVGRRCLSVTLEFGTVEFRRMFEALRADNWLRMRAPAGFKAAADIRRELLECFYPSDPKWRSAVIERCSQVLARTLDAMEERLKADGSPHRG